MLVALDLLIVATALPTMAEELAVAPSAAQWVVTAYGVTFAGLLLAGGAIGDRFGRRRVFVIGLAGFGLASVVCGAAPGLDVLIAGRIAQGAFAALVLPLAVAHLTAAFTAGSLSSALGVFEGVTGVATLLGPVLGGLLAGTVGWPWVFWINPPIVLLLIVGAMFALPESARTPRPIDLPGIISLTAAAALLIAGISHGAEWGWSSLATLALIAGGVLAALTAVWLERRSRFPLLPRRVVGAPGFLPAAASMFFLFSSMYAGVFLLPRYFQLDAGLDPARMGLAIAPWTATLLIGAPIAGATARRVGDRAVLVAGLLMQGAGTCALALLAHPDTAYPIVLAAMLVSGFGASACLPVIQSLVMGAASEDDLAITSGVNNAVQELGGAFGIAAGASVAAAIGGVAPNGPALFVMAAAATLALFVALLIPRRPRVATASIG